MKTLLLTLTLNGISCSADVEPSILLVYALRERWALTGTKIGCDTGQCGACTILMEGRAVKSCTVLALQAEGSSVVTIEGLGRPGRLHPIQRAFQAQHALQCGFCTPGFIMTAADLLLRDPSPDESQIRRSLVGNLCRCTGYQTIVDAVQAAAGLMQVDPGPSLG